VPLKRKTGRGTFSSVLFRECRRGAKIQTVLTKREWRSHFGVQRRRFGATKRRFGGTKRRLVLGKSEIEKIKRGIKRRKECKNN
jgi:hypothetical protein